MKKIMLMLIFVLIFSDQPKASEYSKNLNENKYSLIVGKPYKVKYSGQILEGDKVMIGAKYIAYFKGYRLVYGTLKKDRILRVELQASDDFTIDYFEEIFVVVQNSTNKIKQGVMWDVPTYNICLPSGDVSDFGMDKGFGKKIPRNNKKCKSVYKHGKK